MVNAANGAKLIRKVVIDTDWPPDGFVYGKHGAKIQETL
jgi:hypothetical protein